MISFILSNLVAGNLKTSSPERMRAKYVGNGVLELVDSKVTYRSQVRLVGEDFRKAVSTLDIGDMINVTYSRERAGQNRVDKPRVKWVR